MSGRVVLPDPTKEIADMPGPTIFGREPAFYIGLIEAVLAMVLSFHAFGLTTDTEGVIMAVVVSAASVYTAYVTRQTLLGVGTGLAKATVALFVTFGLDLTEANQTAIIALAVFVLGAFNRTQTSVLPPQQQGFTEHDPQVPMVKVVN